jgi:sugar lactone lactonase YvrE
MVSLRFVPVSLACSVLFGWAVCAGPADLAAQTATFAGAQTTVGSGFSQPTGLAVDSAGDLFVVDNSGSQVVKIAAATGAQTTIGSGLKNPTGVAVDGAGDVFIADAGNNRVVVVPADGGPQLTVGASGLNTPVQIAVDSAGNLYIVDNGNARVVKVSADGSPLTTVGSGFANLQGVAVDASGNVYIADNSNEMVVKVTPGGTQTTVASGLIPTQLAVDLAGDLFIADDGGVRELPAGASSLVNITGTMVTGYGQGVAVDNAGRLFVSVAGQKTVSEVMTGSVDFGSLPVCPAAERNSAACSTTITLNFNVTSPAEVFPYSVSTRGVAIDDYMQNGSETCGAVTSGTTCTLIVTFSPSAPGLRRSAVFLGDRQGQFLATVNVYGTGVAPQAAFYGNGLTTVVSGLSRPSAVALDGGGDLFIADTFNNRVLELPAGGGAQTTVGTGLNLPAGIAIDGSGDIYVTEVGTGDVILIPGPGLGFQGGPVAELNEPVGVTVDGPGNVYIADSSDGFVLRLNVNGSSPTQLATGLHDPAAVAVDALGDLFITDTANNQIVELLPDGTESDLGTGLNLPQGVAVDAAGDIFVADSGNNRIVEIPAGGGAQLTLATGLKSPMGITFDLAGNLYIADTGNNRVVELPFAPPAALHFASTEVGFTSSDSPQNLVVQNIGNQQLNVTNVVYPADFPVGFEASGHESLCTGETMLTPGQVCDLSFNFTPLGPTPQPEQFKITDNTMGVSGSTQSIELAGTALLSQRIVFLLPASTTFSPAPSNLSSYGAATSGLPVSFKIVSGPAKLSGSVMTLTGAGKVVIQASQPGNAAYVAAASVTKTINITKATPAITWAAPAAITYGAKLSSAQLDAKSTVAGKFTYLPAAGAVPSAGTGTLAVTFTPTNASGYATVKASVKITVNKATLTVSAKSMSIKKGSAIPKLTAAYSGFVNGDTAAKALTGAPSLSTTAKSTSPAGTYAITVKQGTLAAKNYAFKLINGVLTITSQ